MDEEQHDVPAAIAALDDPDGVAAGFYLPGDEDAPPPRAKAADRAASLEGALRAARRWHTTQEIVCAAGRRPATAQAHRERIAAIDSVLGAADA